MRGLLVVSDIAAYKHLWLLRCKEPALRITRLLMTPTLNYDFRTRRIQPPASAQTLAAARARNFIWIANTFCAAQGSRFCVAHRHEKAGAGGINPEMDYFLHRWLRALSGGYADPERCASLRADIPRGIYGPIQIQDSM